MHCTVITLFPELITGYLHEGLLGRAVAEGKVQLDTIHLRDFAVNKHGQVDDTPYGGGSGMVLRPEPALAAISHAREKMPRAKVVLVTPRGKPFTQQHARSLWEEATSPGGGLIFLSPRYEGVDERVAAHVDYEISLGDFVLMGGELPALAIIETIARFVPGVLGNEASAGEESFEHGLLEYPQFTKPSEFAGEVVPPVLLSGNHEEIRRWRREQCFNDTALRRPDLIPGGTPARAELSLGLIHYPVLNKDGTVITSSITNLDIHDIARSARTFGVEKFYVVHPTKALRRLAAKILEHWDQGIGRAYNPNRSDALETVALVPDFDDMITDIEQRTGKFPRIIVTSARSGADRSTFAEIRSELLVSDTPHILVFGTGWGLVDELMTRADYRLEPITGVGDFNHLSVRSAAAIILSRLLG